MNNKSGFFSDNTANGRKSDFYVEEKYKP